MPATTFAFAPITDLPGPNTDLPIFRQDLGQRLLENIKDAPFGAVAPMRPEFFKQECEPIEMPSASKPKTESLPKIQQPPSAKSTIGKVMFESNIKMRKLWQQTPAENRESLVEEVQQFFEEITKKYSINKDDVKMEVEEVKNGEQIPNDLNISSDESALVKAL